MASAVLLRHVQLPCIQSFKSILTNTRHKSSTQLLRNISTSTPIPEFNEDPNIKTHADLYKFSLEQPNIFWSKLARSRLAWSKDFSVDHSGDFANGHIEWFTDGELNASGTLI